MRRTTYTRLDVDERRRQLVEAGARMFERYGYDELSMAQIAREAGISKALLYHYFRSKPEFFTAAMEEQAIALAQRTDVDPDLPPPERLAAALDGYLAWIEENAGIWRRFVRAAGAVPEMRDILETFRAGIAERLLEVLRGDDAEPTPEVRTAVWGWLWLLDGVCLDWIEHRDLDRATVHALLLRALRGTLGPAAPPAG